MTKISFSRTDSRSRQSGFSLIELMTVVGIIGVLFMLSKSIIIPKVRRALAVNQLQVIAKGLIAVREIDGRTLGEIAGSYFDCGGCWDGISTINCTNMDRAMKAWQFTGVKTTPWGGYYWVDANNGEFGPDDICREDTIGAYDNDAKAYIIITIPPLHCDRPSWSSP
jgi:prepilin-type N-terminal cleavage/methylation domain-containing protein